MVERVGGVDVAYALLIRYSRLPHATRDAARA
jgi:hypothetical protein